jgi:hypothetical protein
VCMQRHCRELGQKCGVGVARAASHVAITLVFLTSIDTRTHTLCGARTTASWPLRGCGTAVHPRSQSLFLSNPGTPAMEPRDTSSLLRSGGALAHPFGCRSKIYQHRNRQPVNRRHTCTLALLPPPHLPHGEGNVSVVLAQLDLSRLATLSHSPSAEALSISAL